MNGEDIAGQSLVEIASPYILHGDRDGLARRIREDWSAECLALLLDSPDVEVVHTVLLCLGLVGSMSVTLAVAKLLQADDPRISAAAEDTLWSIWFRAGGHMAQTVLSRIAKSVKTGETEDTVPMLTELIRAYPQYAEAYHQRSQAYYLQSKYQFALRDACRALELNPLHFGAMANQAHALFALGQHKEALKTYRKVLRLHPRLPGIREDIDHVRRHLALVVA